MLKRRSPWFRAMARVMLTLVGVQTGVPTYETEERRPSFGPARAAAQVVPEPTASLGLIVGRRTLSATAGDPTVVEYTVYNETPSIARAAELVVELSSDVEYVSSSVEPTTVVAARRSWSLGDVDPFESVQVRMTLSDEAFPGGTFDLGATASASIAGSTAQTQAPPIGSLPPVSDTRLLACNAYADCDDPHIQLKAAQLDYSPVRIFEFVRDEIRFEPYEGSLRGSRGTLWSRAGNATDKSTLLIALLRASGIPARYAAGRIDDATAGRLIEEMFRTPNGALGCPPNGAATVDPTTDETLIGWTREHRWVELDLGTGFEGMDASSTSHEMGEVLADRAEVGPDLPASAQHRVRIRLDAELSGYGLDESRDIRAVVDEQFTTSELVGRSLTIGHAIQEGQQSAFGKTNTYSPYLTLVDQVGGEARARMIGGIDYQEQITGVAGILLTRLRVNVDHTSPSGEVAHEERDLYDAIGAAARLNGSEQSLAANGVPPIDDLDLAVLNILPGLQDPRSLARIDASVAERREALQALQPELQRIESQGGAQGNDVALALRGRQLVRELTQLGAQTAVIAFAAASDRSLQQLARLYFMQAYYNTPRVIIGLTNASPDALSVRLDIRRNEILSIPMPGQTNTTSFQFEMTRGLMESALESEIASAIFDRPALSTVDVFGALESNATGLELVTSSERLARLSISEEAKARISRALDEGRVALVPKDAVLVSGLLATAWYEVDPVSGHTIGVTEDGGHQALIQYQLLLNNPLLRATGSVAGLALGFSTGILQFVGNFLDALNHGREFEDAVRSAKGKLIIQIGLAILALIADAVSSHVLDSLEGFTGDIASELGKYALCILPVVPGLIDTEEGGFDSGEVANPLNVRTLIECTNDALQGVGVDYSIPIPDLGNIDIFLQWVEIGTILGLAGSFVHLYYAAGIDPVVPRHLVEPLQRPAITSMDLVEIVHDPIFFSSAAGTAVHSLHRARIQNSSEESRRFEIHTGSAPSGFTLAPSVDSIVVGAGEAVEVGVCLEPDGVLPSPGTSVEFTVTADASADGGEIQTKAGSFTYGDVHGVELAANPTSLVASPGSSAQIEIEVQTRGNVDEDLILDWIVEPGFVVSGVPLSSRLSQAGQQTATLSVDVPATVPLGSRSKTLLVADLCGPERNSGCTLAEPNTVARVVEIQIVSPQLVPIARAAELSNGTRIDGPLDDLRDTLQSWQSAPDDSTFCTTAARRLENVSALGGSDPMTPALAEAFRAAAASARSCELAEVLEQIESPSDQLIQLLALRPEYAVEASIDPQSAILNMGESTVLTLTLQNRGSRENPISLATQALPAGASLSGLPQQITLGPGEARSFQLSLINDIGESTSFSLEVTATPTAAPSLAAKGTTLIRVSPGSAQIVSVQATPNRVDSGTPVSVSATILNSANIGRSMVSRITVLDRSRNPVPGMVREVPLRLEATTQIPLIELGLENTTDLSDGIHYIRVEALDETGEKSIGAARETFFIVGDLVRGTVDAEPSLVVPGNPSVRTRIGLESNQILETRCGMPAVDLGMDRLPSEQGWSYTDLAPLVPAPLPNETVVFSSQDGVLRQNSIGSGTSGPGYEISIPDDLMGRPFCMETRARVLEHEEISSSSAGFALAFGQQLSDRCVGFGLAVDGPGRHRITWNNQTLTTAIDVTQFHDYELVADPDTREFSLFVDDEFAAGGDWSQCERPERFIFGDGTGTANAAGEIASLRISPIGFEVGPNLLANGDFEEGLVAISTEFLAGGINDPATYRVVDNPAQHHGASASYGDHSSGFGQMMMLNGTDRGAMVAWRQSVSVNPNSRYEFGLWISNWSGGVTTDFDVRINDESVLVGRSPSVAGIWIPHRGTWDSGTADSARIEIVNTSSSFGGNDFALDDLEMVIVSAADQPVATEIVHRFPNSGFEVDLDSAGPNPTSITARRVEWSSVGTSLQEFSVSGVVTDLAPGELRMISDGTTIRASRTLPPLPDSPPVVLVRTGDLAYYNSSIGRSLNGTSAINGKQHFPLTIDPSVEFAPDEEPDLSAAADVLGDWLAPVPDLTAGGWTSIPVSIPSQWEVDTEVAAVYVFESAAIRGLQARIGVDNGVYVWLDGEFKGGAMAGGGVSPGEHVFELGDLAYGTHYLQLLLEDHGTTNGFDVVVQADSVDTRPPVILQTIDLPPISVAAAHIIGLSPSAGQVCPGCSVEYAIELANPGTVDENYQLSSIGLERLVSNLPSVVAVPAGQTVQVPLVLTASRDELPGANTFAIVAATSSGGFDGALANLEITTDPPPPILLQTRGVGLEIPSSGITAGPATPATSPVQGSEPVRFEKPRVRIFNLGDSRATYELASAFPAGWGVALGTGRVTVLPGLSNFVEVELTTIPPTGTAAGFVPFTVTATDITDPRTTQSVEGVVEVVEPGVVVALSPDVGSPGSVFTGFVANSGLRSETYDLTLTGSASVSATGLPSTVTLEPGTGTNVGFTVGPIGNAIAGNLDLILRATARSAPAVHAQARAKVAVPVTRQVSAQISPTSSTVTSRDPVSLLLNVQNLGTAGDGYFLQLTSRGPVSAAFRGLDGRPTSSIHDVRLPAQGSGAIAIDVEPHESGEATIRAEVVSMTDSRVRATSEATLALEINQAPTASIGMPASTAVGELVELDGSASNDSDERPSPLTYRWRLLSAPQGSALVGLTDESLPIASFTPDQRGEYEVELTVSDGDLEDSATLVVQVANRPPAANAGPDQNVRTGHEAGLDGSASRDPDGDLISYTWSFESVPEGSALTDGDLQPGDAAMPSFVPDVDGRYVVQLAVYDGIDTDVDTVEITASIPNVAPNADAGSDQNVLVGTHVNLDGTASEDPDDGPNRLAYSWRFRSVATGSMLDDSRIGGSVNELATFQPDVPGEFVVELIVDDGLASDVDEVSIVSAKNTPPNADAGSDRVVPVGTDVALDGSQSNDPDRRPEALGFEWRFVSIPASSRIGNDGLEYGTTASPRFRPDVGGQYVLELKVSDGLDEDSDNVVISAKDGFPTRTIGFYKNHPGVLEMCLDLNARVLDVGFLRIRDESFDDEIDATITKSIKGHCKTILKPDSDARLDSALELGLGLLSADPARRVDGSKRDRLDSSRVKAGRQLIAAICNATLLAADPTPYLDLALGRSTLASCDQASIDAIADAAARFNESGDRISLPFDPGPADPNAPRDDPTDPFDSKKSPRGKVKRGIAVR